MKSIKVILLKYIVWKENNFMIVLILNKIYISGEKRIIFSYSFSCNEKYIELVYYSLTEKRKEIQKRVDGLNIIKFRIKN